ncbi:MAG TPA: GrpB family protein [Gaiellales bacterium]|nr:GrpB family protein [Gaiellales bacterium]
MITIADPDPAWAAEFLVISERLMEAAGREGVLRIDHVGSTSVPGLPAKDVIDVQITVADDGSLTAVPDALAARGWRRSADISRDHQVTGLPADLTEWRKVVLSEPEGERRVNVHVRIHGRANQRYALLFRDFLRTHPDAAQAYALVKKGLAALALDTGSYADAKDPACDLIYHAAEKWARDEGWPAP